MNNFDDFDLDIQKVKTEGRDIQARGGSGKVCEYITTKIIDTVLSKVISYYKESYQHCTSDCETKTPSICVAHHSCNRAMEESGLQRRC